jgi:hypothetical protein
MRPHRARSRGVFTLAPFVLASGLAACGPADGPPPGEPGSPIPPERAGGPPPPLVPDEDPIER